MKNLLTQTNKYWLCIGVALLIVGCVSPLATLGSKQLTFIDIKDGKRYFGKVNSSGSSGEAIAQIGNVQYSGPLVYSLQGGGYSLGIGSFSGSAYSGAKSATAYGTGSSASFGVSAQGSGLITLSGTNGSFIRCVFDFNKMSDTGLGKCVRNDGREYDLTIISVTETLAVDDGRGAVVETNKMQQQSPIQQLKHTPSEVVVSWNEKSIQSSNSNNWAEAIRTASAAIAMDPKYADAYVNRCRAYIEFGYLAEAAKDCNTAIALDPSNLAAVNNSGVIERRKKDDAAASKYFERACNGGLELGCKNFKEVNGYFPANKAEAVNRLLNEANIKFSDKDWIGVVALTTKALELEPSNPNALTNRSGAYINLGKISDAKRDAEVAIKTDPDMGMAYNNLGVVYEQMKDLRQAKLQFSIACGLRIDLGCFNLNRLGN